MTVINDLAQALGNKFSDARDLCATHATKHWSRRDISDIKGVVFHQSISPQVNDGHLAIARYHVGPNHISDTGCPGACYTIIVTPDGVAHQVNDLEDITWSQGSPKTSKSSSIMRNANRQNIGICFIGDFAGPTYAGSDEVTLNQWATATVLWKFFSSALNIKQTRLMGHYHFGKQNCPGISLGGFIEAIRAEGLNPPSAVIEWQQCLQLLRYLGPSDDDGIWGPISRQALDAFQHESGIGRTGFRDRFTALELAFKVTEASSEG